MLSYIYWISNVHQNPVQTITIDLFNSPHISSSFRSAFKTLIHFYSISHGLQLLVMLYPSCFIQVILFLSLQSICRCFFDVILSFCPLVSMPVQLNIIILLVSILITWPIHHQLRSIMSSLSIFVFQVLWWFSFDIVFDHLIFSICLRHLFLKVFNSYFSCSFS